jgi:hypothetical protein
MVKSPAFNNIVTGSLGRAQKAAAKSATGRAIGRGAAGTARSLGRMAAGTAEQSVEEGLQKAWSLLGEYFAKEISNTKDEDYYWPYPGQSPRELLQGTRFGDIKPVEGEEGTSFEQRTKQESIRKAWDETTNAAVSFWLTQIPGTVSIGISETMRGRRAKTDGPAAGTEAQQQAEK